MRTRHCIVSAIVLCAVLLLPRLALAQGSGGSIAGNVKDTTGGGVPGVTVEVASPALIEKVHTTVTDGQGNYKITELRPGVYSVTFTLAGFSVVKREGIELSAGFTAPVNAELKVGSVEETITVTGAAPVVDVQSVRTQSVLKQETLDALPSGQCDLNQLASLTLGATVSTAGHNDVGGGQQRTYKFNTVGVAEQVVDTGGNAAETETGGANVNMVPKEGGAISSASMAPGTTRASGWPPAKCPMTSSPAEVRRTRTA